MASICPHCKSSSVVIDWDEDYGYIPYCLLCARRFVKAQSVEQYVADEPLEGKHRGKYGKSRKKGKVA